MEYVLQTSNLTKAYGHKKALYNVSINVPKGSVYGLVGKNGAGKTTLMRIVAGLSTQTQGNYMLFGKENAEKERSSLGVLIESPGLYDRMTAHQNLEYFSHLYGVNDTKKNEDLLAIVGLKNLGKKKVKQFSLGMKQRLGIAVSLLGNPKVLILDEPINGLDPEGVYEIRIMLEKLNKEYGTTVIIASHILSELYKLATHYAIIDDGKLISEFSKEELEKQCCNCVNIVVEKQCVKDTQRIISETFPQVKSELIGTNTFRIFSEINLAEFNEKLVNNKIRVCELGYSEENVERFFVEKLSGGVRVD